MAVILLAIAVVMYVVITELLGGPNAADSSVSTYFIWSVAHAHFACAYINPRSLGATTAPVYPLIAAGVAALFKMGNGVAFPNSSALGPQCIHASSAIYQWSVAAKVLRPTLWIGYLGFVVLASGTASIMRSMARGFTRGAATTLIFIACAPPVVMCLLDFFHPQDMLALGLVMSAISLISKKKWWSAGLILGTAVLTQQFAWLAALGLVLITPRREQWRLIAGACFSAVIIVIPLLVLTSGRAWWSLIWGTGNSSSTQSVLVETGLHGQPLFVVARLAPLIFTAATAIWMRTRWHEKVLFPVPLLSLLTLSMMWRLVFEVNLWGYYFMAVTVFLLVLEAVIGQLRLGVVAWIVVTSIVSSDAELLHRPWFDPLPMWIWQGILLLWAFVEVISNLSANSTTDNPTHLVA